MEYTYTNTHIHTHVICIHIWKSMPKCIYVIKEICIFMYLYIMYYIEMLWNTQLQSILDHLFIFLPGHIKTRKKQ